jgi:hypothetical protein
MELHYHNFLMYVGGDPSQYSQASGHARQEHLGQVCPRNIVLLHKQVGAVHMCAAPAGIHSGLGNSAAFDGKEDSEGEWYVVSLHISLAL